MVVALVACGILGFVAWQRERTAVPEVAAFEHDVPPAIAGASVEDGAPPSPTGSPGTIDLETEVATVTVVPAPAGRPIRVTGEFDPRRYALEHERIEAPDGRWTLRVRFGPIGSPMMAMLQVKLGGVPPALRIEIPRGTPVAIAGDLHGSYAAMELGGLRIEEIDLFVESGAAAISFLGPLEAPMERLDLRGHRGSAKVSGLGHASPRTVRIAQGLGELDLDFRGDWLRDADIEIFAHLAGGTLWLPGDVDVEGVGTGVRRADDGELPRPRLRIDMLETAGRVVVVEP